MLMSQISPWRVGRKLVTDRGRGGILDRVHRTPALAAHALHLLYGRLVDQIWASQANDRFPPVADIRCGHSCPGQPLSLYPRP